MNKLFVITGINQPLVGVAAVEVEQVADGKYRVGNVENASDDALLVVDQPGFIGLEQIEPYVDQRDHVDDLCSWPERTLFTSKKRALKSAVLVIDEKLSALTYYSEFWYSLAPQMPFEDDQLDKMDIVHEEQVEAMRTSLHASKMMLEVQLAA